MREFGIYEAKTKLADLIKQVQHGKRITDRKFNRMRPSMARVLGFETRSAKAD